MSVSEKRCEAILAALPDLLLEVDRKGRLYDCRAPRPEVLSASPQVLVGKTVAEAFPKDAADVINEALGQAAATGRHCGEVYSLETPEGMKWFELSIAAAGDHRDRDCRFIVLARDITERRRAQEELKREVERNAFLIREIHHRVKNNLSAIVGLLRIQLDTGRGRHPILRTAFENLEARVTGMVLLYENLYRCDGISTMKIDDYLRDITQAVSDRFQRNDIVMRLKLPAVQFNIETATPCGLLVNELLTNAYAHAFPDGAGHVSLTLECESDDGRWRLTVADDGVGLPPGFSTDADETVGMLLVSLFAKQLHAKMESSRVGDRGTMFSFVFTQVKPSKGMQPR